MFGRRVSPRVEATQGCSRLTRDIIGLVCWERRTERRETTRENGGNEVSERAAEVESLMAAVGHTGRLTTILSAKMTRRNWPKPPMGPIKGAPRSPPSSCEWYASSQVLLLTNVLIIAAPKHSTKIRGALRPM